MRGRRISPLKVFVSQFNDFLIYLPLTAALSVFAGFLPGNERDYTEAGLILCIGLARDLCQIDKMTAVHPVSCSSRSLRFQTGKVRTPELLRGLW